MNTWLARLTAHLEAFVHLLLLEVAKRSVGVHLSQRVSLRKYHLLAAVGMPPNVVLQWRCAYLWHCLSRF